MIQNKFKSELGLLVDIVLQGKKITKQFIITCNFFLCWIGKGTTNDGNTARRFFKNCEKSSEITGVNLNLIKRFGTILKSMASGYEININAFQQYTMDTAKLYVKLYPWYYMPASVHKIWMHGALELLLLNLRYFL